MNKSFIFFLVSTIITLLSVAVFNTGPIINGKIGSDGLNPWKTLNCMMISDLYKDKKEEYDKEIDEEEKNEIDKDMKRFKKQRDSCNRKKAMYGLEYSAFTIDLIIGFVCSLLGLLHYLDEGKSFIPKTGLIGLISGAIAFIISLIYLIYSILVYSKDTNGNIKTDENRVFAKWDSTHGVYMCLFYEKDNEDSIYAKFNELGKKQYNYNKDLYIAHKYDSKSEINNCIEEDNDYIEECQTRNNLTITGPKKYITDNSKDCNQLYINPEDNAQNSDINNRWLTTIILTVIIILCEIFLALFGFLLFKNKEEIEEVPVA